MIGNAYGNMFPNEGCGVCMTKRLIVLGDWLKIEDNQVFELVVFHLNIQVAHILKDSFIQLVGANRIAMSYTFATASNISVKVERARPKLIAITATILFQELVNVLRPACDCHIGAKIWCQRTSLLTDERVLLLDSAFHQSKWNKFVGSFARSAELHEFYSVKHR